MNIEVDVNLYYSNGEGFHDYETLYLHARFREPGKIFSKLLERELVSTFYVHNHIDSDDAIEDMNQFYELVEKAIKDEELLARVATDMVTNYFEKKEKNMSDAEKRKAMSKKVNSLPSFKINVKIK